MQKFIVSLCAIASSLGLFAAGLDPSPHLSGANFQDVHFVEGEEFFTRHDDTNGAPDSAGTPSFWITNDEDDFEGTISSYMNGDDKIKYLDFESNITNPVYRTIKDCYRADSISEATPTNIGKGLFMDTRVKFTPYTVTDVHTPPIGLEGTAIPNGCQDKLVVWLREREVESEENGVTVTNMVTNLVATAAYFEGTDNARTIKHYELVLPNDITYSSLVTDFHRLTIKAFKNITTSEAQLDRQAGFVVYLDGDTHPEPLEYVDADSQATRGGAGIDGSAVSKLTDTIKNRYYTETKKCLLPCLIPGDGQQSISAVGFSGTGAVSEIYFDDYSTGFPEFAMDPFVFDLCWTKGVTGFEFSKDNGSSWETISGLEDAGVTNLSVNPSLEGLKIRNVTYLNDDKYKAGVDVWFDSTGEYYDTDAAGASGVFNLNKQAASYTIAAFERNYAVGEEEFQTLFGKGDKGDKTGAIEYAIANGGWLKLGRDVEINEGEGEGIRQIVINGNETLKLDLAGHTIKGTRPVYPTIQINEGGCLEITNSTATLGAVLDSPMLEEDPGSAIGISSFSAVTINGGQIETFKFGDDAEEFSIALNAGKFLAVGYLHEGPEEEWVNFYLQDYVSSGSVAIHSSVESDRHYYTVAPGVVATIGKTDEIDGIASVVVTQGLDAVTSESEDYTVASGLDFTVTYKAKDHYLFGNGTGTTNATYNITANAEYDAPVTHADLVTLTLKYDETKVEPTVTQDGETKSGTKSGTDMVYQVLKDVEVTITWNTKDIWVFDDGSTEKVEKYTLSASEEKSAPAVKEGTFTVSFNNNGHGGTAPADQIIQSGSKANKPTPDPEETGWDFGGWYKEAACQNVWDFGTDVVTAPTTLYAKWTQHVYFPQASIEQEWAGREGTAASPFVIRKYEDLVALQEMVAAGQTTAGVYFEQVADITFPAVSETTPAWAGIGQAKGTTAFAGVYNGNGQKILNMTLDGNVEYAALFSHLDTATVSNLEVNIAGVVAENGAEIAVAGIAGYADHGVTLADIKVTGTIGTTENPINDNVSGIMCRTTQDGTQTTTVTRVEFAGTINAKSRSNNRKVAGFCGCPYGKIIFNDCVMSGTIINNTEVTMTNEGGTGGFIAFGAYAGSGNAKCDITFNNCSVTGTVTGNKKDIMGLFYGTNRGEASTIQGVNKVKVSTFETLPVLTADGTKDFNNSYGLADANDNTMIDVVAASATGVIAAGNTVYLLKSDLTPAYTFADVGTIAFNTNLYAAAAFNVTVNDDVKLALSESEEAGVVTFTAVMHPYVITFNKDVDVLKEELPVVYGDKLTADKIPDVSADKEGHTFTGWLPSDPTNATVTGDATYTAQWTINQYEVTYTVDGHDAGSEMVKWRESPANIPAIADKKGYSFTGWSPSDPTNAVITCATNFVTTYAAIQYEITYDYGAGTGPATSNTEEYVISAEDQTIHLTAPTPALGYDFTGFALKETREGVTFNDKTNMVIAAGQIDPISVQANYEAIVYTISYANVEDATKVPTLTEFTVEDSITIGNPEKEGYTFNGWTWDTQSTPTKDVTIQAGRTENITFTANWTINTYLVTFNKNIDAEAAGNVNDWPADTNVTWNTTVNDPDPKPTCEGYRFIGWYTTADCATAFDFENTKITDTTTIYAKWVKTFTVTFTAGDGIDVIKVNDVAYETALTVDTNTTINVTADVKTGYNEFAGASYTIVCDTNVTLTATLKTFTVKVPSAEHVTVAVTNGTTGVGTESRDYTFDYGTDVKVVFTAAAGYEFTKNTSTNIDSLVENVVIEAPTVKATEYTITYVKNGGIGTNCPESFTVEDSEIYVGTLDKDGYTFDGWTGGWLTEKKTEFWFTPSEHLGDVTFTANFTIQTRSVTFNKNIDAEAAGNVNDWPADTNVTWNTTVNDPDPKPTCDGYRFDGWYQEPACENAFDFTKPITSPTTIYAKWVKTFEVKFTASTGIKSIKVDDADYTSETVLVKDTNAVVEVTAEVKEGYEPFTAASYTIVCDTNVTLTTTLKTYTVTFKSDDADYAVSNNVPHGTAFADVEPENPTKTGYTFAGWDPVVETITGEAIFTAQWTAEDRTVTFYTNSVPFVVRNVKYDQKIGTIPEMPVITGYNGAWRGTAPDAETIVQENLDYFYDYTAKPFTFTVKGGANATIMVTTNNATAFAYTEPFQIAFDTTWSVEATANDKFKFNDGAVTSSNGVVKTEAPVTVTLDDAVPAEITINVTWGATIAAVATNGGNVVAGDVKLPADTTEVAFTLTAKNMVIPVFKVAIGDNGAAVVTNKSPVIQVQDGTKIVFSAEEAKVDDPNVTEDQKKDAIIDAIDAGDDHDAAVAKVEAVVTTEETPAEGKVKASDLAKWITEKNIQSADLAASDYVVASVKLDVAPITASTAVKVDTVEKQTSDLAVTVKIGEEDATKEQIESFVEICDDLGAANDWEKLTVTESALKSAVKIEAGKLVITPQAGISKLFLKVVIPADANVN